jgi:hypothetical protein
MKARHALLDAGMQLAEWPDIGAVNFGKRGESAT